MPKTSFRSYLSSTVGVLGFTTSSVFFTSGFFFPPKSGMIAPAVFAFVCLFVCLVPKRSLSAAHSSHGDRRESTGGRAEPTLAACQSRLLANLESRLPFTRRLAAATATPCYLNPLLPWQTACQTL